MTRFYQSLQFKLTMSFMFMIVLISGFSYFYTYNAARTAIKESMREQLVQAGQMVVSQITPDKLRDLQALKPGDDAKPPYKSMVDFVYGFRARTPDLANIYIMRMENGKVRFVLDDLSSSRPADKAAIGEEYTGYSPQMMNAFKGDVTASNDYYTDKWGTFLSSFVPLKDKDGKVLFVVGIDMVVRKAIEKQNFIGSLIYIVMGISIMAAALLISFFSATIIRDINALKAVANRLSQGDIDVEIPLIKRQSEIKELGEAMRSVMAAVAQLKEIAEAAAPQMEGEGHHG